MDKQEALQKVQELIKDLNKNDLRLLHSCLCDDGYEYQEILVDDLTVVDSDEITSF